MELLETGRERELYTHGLLRDKAPMRTTAGLNLTAGGTTDEGVSRDPALLVEDNPRGILM